VRPSRASEIFRSGILRARLAGRGGLQRGKVLAWKTYLTPPDAAAQEESDLAGWPVAGKRELLNPSLILKRSACMIEGTKLSLTVCSY
jgi:hypothetical protein